MIQPQIRVIIPALNEQESIPLVLAEIPDIVCEIIVVSNGSTDLTAGIAAAGGATVLSEPRRGYGYACLKGIDYLINADYSTDIVVFLDADYSDFPEELTSLVKPIISSEVDFVVGARVPRFRESGSMTFPQRFGNRLATGLMKLLFSSRFTDLGPFRAIRYDTLIDLDMQDKTYGWTVEMQLKVLKQNIPYCEIPVHYKNRVGISKVSGTFKGAIFAGIKILSWIFKYGLK